AGLGRQPRHDGTDRGGPAPGLAAVRGRAGHPGGDPHAARGGRPQRLGAGEAAVRHAARRPEAGHRQRRCPAAGHRGLRPRPHGGVTYDESANRTGRYSVVASLQPELIGGTTEPPLPIKWPAGRRKPPDHPDDRPLTEWEGEVPLLVDPQTKDYALALPLAEA